MKHIGVSPSDIEQVRRIVARLDAQADGPDADRRVHPRINFAHPMWLNLPASLGKPWVHVFSRNLSTGGLAFLTRHIFYSGQYLIIAHQLNENCPQLVLCKVGFVRTVSMGIMEIGLIFQTALADPDNRRIVPSEWTTLVLRNDWLARHEHPHAVAAPS